MRRSPLLSWGLKGPSTKSDYNAPAEWQTLRSSSTSRTASSKGSKSTYTTLSGTYIAPPEPPTHQLMVTAHKAGSKNKEIQDKVRARAMVATDPGEGMAELGQQIATNSWLPWPRLGRTTTPLVHQVAPGREAMGGDTMVVIPPVAQTPVMVGAALNRLPQPVAYLPGMGQGALWMEVMERVTKGLVQGGRAQPISRTPILSNALGARGGITWPGNALPQHQL